MLFALRCLTLCHVFGHDPPLNSDTHTQWPASLFDRFSMPHSLLLSTTAIQPFRDRYSESIIEFASAVRAIYRPINKPARPIVRLEFHHNNHRKLKSTTQTEKNKQQTIVPIENVRVLLVPLTNEHSSGKQRWRSFLFTFLYTILILVRSYLGNTCWQDESIYM